MRAAVIKYRLARAKAAAQRFIPRPWWAQVVAAVSLTLLLLVSMLLWMEVNKRFPWIPAGSFYGSISGIFSDQDEDVKFYAERSPDGTLLVSVLKKGWIPEMVALVEASDSETQRALFPVVLTGPRMRLRLIGRQVEKNSYVGVVRDLESGASGAWKLTPFEHATEKLSESEQKYLEHWIALQDQSMQKARALKRIKQVVPERRQELERLTEIVTQGDELRAQGDERFRAAEAKLQEIAAELERKRAEAAEMKKKVELSHRVTKKGKLVSLAREAFARDNRWLDSMMKGVPAPLNSNLQTSLERGREILRLKREILREEQRINSLLGGSAVPRPRGPEDSEGSEWLPVPAESLEAAL